MISEIGRQSCFSDTGGTFTDTFIVNESGSFVVGKAPTTPDNLAVGYFNSIASATQKLELPLEQCLRNVDSVGYASTTVINTVITRTGKRIGLIVTKGFEHLTLMQRGVQSYTEYDIVDRIHARTHRFVEPLVLPEDTLGVTERVDCLGKIIIPIYKQECRRAAEILIDKGIDVICVVFLFCWQNNNHEVQASEIILDVAKKKQKIISVYLSHEVNPIGRELPRLNATLIEAYTRDIAIGGLKNTENRLKDYGYHGKLWVLQSTGGVTTTDSLLVVESLESGPAGGILGARYVSSYYNLKNFVTTDVGGTSFDIGMVTDNQIDIEQEPVCARMVLGVPMISVTSIGAGGGTIASIDYLTGRLKVGPQSAGAAPGPVCYDLGGGEPTVTDADLVLGYINPQYFLGGGMSLNKEKAALCIEEKIAKPLGVSTEIAAQGIRNVVDARMRETIRGTILSRGKDIESYHLFSFGGAGPTHVAAFTEGLPLKGILIFPYSSVFCAFGAACADFVRNYTQAANLVCVPSANNDQKVALVSKLREQWADLERQSLSDVFAEGFNREHVQLTRQIRMRYGRQLNQILVTIPPISSSSSEDWDLIVDMFENSYKKMFTESAMYPQAGYEIVEVSTTATISKVKPKLVKHELVGPQVQEKALKGQRKCFFNSKWADTVIYDWEHLQAGNSISGPAIIEADTQTLVVPQGRSINVDEYLTIWMK